MYILQTFATSLPLVLNFKFVSSGYQDNFSVSPTEERQSNRGPRDPGLSLLSLERIRLCFGIVKCANPIGNY